MVREWDGGKQHRAQPMARGHPTCIASAFKSHGIHVITLLQCLLVPAFSPDLESECLFKLPE